jgi:hypothetical protein
MDVGNGVHFENLWIVEEGPLVLLLDILDCDLIKECQFLLF